MKEAFTFWPTYPWLVPTIRLPVVFYWEILLPVRFIPMIASMRKIINTNTTCWMVGLELIWEPAKNCRKTSAVEVKKWHPFVLSSEIII